MQEFLTQHWQIVLVLVSFNVAITAAQTILQKIEDATPEVEGPESAIEKAKLLLGKVSEVLNKVLDWLVGNKPH